jgi:hypothetical protein
LLNKLKNCHRKALSGDEGSRKESATAQQVSLSHISLFESAIDLQGTTSSQI